MCDNFNDYFLEANKFAVVYFDTNDINRNLNHEKSGNVFLELESKYKLEDRRASFNEPSANNHYNDFYTIDRNPSIRKPTPRKPTTNVSAKSRKQYDTSRPYQCSYCPKRFTQKGNMHTHERLHTGHYPFECHVCSQKFPQLSNLNRHMLNHTTEFFRCGVCFKQLKSKTELVKHSDTHKPEKIYSCSACSKKFSYEWSLKAHEKVHRERPREPPAGPAEASAYFKCGSCREKFYSKGDLKEHERLHVKSVPECAGCKKNFRHVGHLARHLKLCCKHS
ncbi:unnamed protein product [Phyllotreta striolata]|uniref:C2H2-type domain-containing protein n=1 Tax=Phyllotreta striolata TaxID=444603 RepID=A0A9N9XM28_PHYSR|nr:unnamed protein product [Phyllotreta striolata]